MTFVLVAGFTLLLCLIALRVPALGLGLAAGADLVLMEGVRLGGTTIALESFFFLYLICVPVIAQLVVGGRAHLRVREARPFVLFVLGRYASDLTGDVADLGDFAAAAADDTTWAVCCFGATEQAAATAAAFIPAGPPPTTTMDCA